MERFYEHERRCTECGETFWGTAKANFCSPACKVRRWRAARTGTQSAELAQVCEEILRRRAQGCASYAKLLPRLFRRVATDLRLRGWDPIELLLSIPDEPATANEDAPGGVECLAPRRRRWLHAPERELELLYAEILRRKKSGRSTAWYVARAQQLRDALAARTPNSPSHA